MTQKAIRPKEIIRLRNRRLIAVTLIILVLLTLYMGNWWWFNKDWVSTDDAFVSGHLVNVKAQTEGAVTEILAENTQMVKRGQLLIRLDGIRAKIELQHAEATLAETVRAIAALKISVQTYTHKIAAKQAELDQVQHDLRRFKGAEKDDGASAQQIQNANDKVNELKAAIAALLSEKSGIEAQVQGVSVDNHPAVEKAKNLFRRAFLEYQRRNIFAPVSGYVAKRRVEVGDTVKEGVPLMVIVPLDDLWIEANLLEAQARDIRPGQSVEITTDLYSNDIVYHGKVQGLQPGTGSSFALFPADNSTGNFIHVAERVPVRIGLNQDELSAHPLRPGLSTFTKIHASEKGEMLLSPMVKTEGNANYTTDVFDNELNESEVLIKEIISKNLSH
jgi:membrane fusion protein, multidrug efflux system